MFTLRVSTALHCTIEEPHAQTQLLRTSGDKIHKTNLALKVYQTRHAIDQDSCQVSRLMCKHTESEPRLLCSNTRHSLLNTHSLTPQHHRQTRNSQRNPMKTLARQKDIKKGTQTTPLSSYVNSRKKTSECLGTPNNRSASNDISIPPAWGPLDTWK